jgi:thioesterase domain-containing protein
MSGEPSASELERYLREHIPLSLAMGVQVREATRERVALAAPLAPNINHRHTVFGGSAAAVAMLACWTLLYLRLAARQSSARLVIQRSEMRYERPIPGDFVALCEYREESAWERFHALLSRRGRARIELSATVTDGTRQCAFFRGEFVAVRGETTQTT